MRAGCQPTKLEPHTEMWGKNMQYLLIEGLHYPQESGLGSTPAGVQISQPMPCPGKLSPFLAVRTNQVAPLTSMIVFQPLT